MENAKKIKNASDSTTPNVSSNFSGDSGNKLDANKMINVPRSNKSKSEEEWKRQIHEEFHKLEPNAKWSIVAVEKIVNHFQATCNLKNGQQISGNGKFILNYLLVYEYIKSTNLIFSFKTMTIL